MCTHRNLSRTFTEDIRELQDASEQWTLIQSSSYTFRPPQRRDVAFLRGGWMLGDTPSPTPYRPFPSLLRPFPYLYTSHLIVVPPSRHFRVFRVFRSLSVHVPFTFHYLCSFLSFPS